ncbi:penicillin acylase family protein [Kitasatospora sp. NPDC094028]
MTRRQFNLLPRRFAPALAALALASVTATLLPGTAVAAGDDRELGGRDGYSAQIRRTEYGIPHVLAHDFRGLGYGYGYAFAQDNLCELANQVVTLRGERSRWFGPDARTPGDGANLAGDTYHQGLLRSGTVRRLLDQPAPVGPTEDVRRMVEGYAAGYDRYLRDTGVDGLPDAGCRGQKWVGPITAEDIWNLVYEVNGNAGIADAQGAIATAAPPGATPGAAASGGASAPAARASAVRRPSDGSENGRDLGSNAWALGRDATRDGHGMLLANPHLPWVGGHRFYQVQLTIPGVLDVSGAALYGTPVVEIGHTRDLAFTATTSFADHASVYRLTLVPGDPTSYLVDGRAEKMGSQEVPVTVRGADGTLSTVTRTIHTSRYGPVLADQDAGIPWTDTYAYAFRDANADNLRSMSEWLALDRSQSLAELKRAQDTYQGVPWNYTFATDVSGATYFTDSSAVPHLSDEQLARCTLVPSHDLPAVLDGSTTSCDWGTDPHAVVPGLFGPADHPRLDRTDYVANSNNNPYLTNPASPLAGYPGIYGTQPRLGPRAQLSLRMIAERRDGTDGLGAPGFTLPTLQAAMFGDREQNAELGRDDAVAMCRANPVLTASDGSRVDVKAACDVLAAWNTRADDTGHGAVLWQAFGYGLHTRNPVWRVPYDPAQPLTTPRGLNGDSPDVRRALADAVQRLDKAGTALDATIGDVDRWAGIALHGCDDGAGCFNVVTAGPDSGSTGGSVPQAGTGARGSSFVMATELTPQGPRTRTVLTYGESANPASPHYTDQTALFSRKQWVTERFTEAEIKASPALETTRLRG